MDEEEERKRRDGIERDSVFSDGKKGEREGEKSEEIKRQCCH